MIEIVASFVDLKFWKPNYEQLRPMCSRFDVLSSTLEQELICLDGSYLFNLLVPF
jgi:hypothetical protein